jgi:hypothetical protein
VAADQIYYHECDDGFVMILRATILIAVMALTSYSQQRKDATGVIRGVVFNEIGERIAGVKVTARPDSGPFVGVLPNAFTAEDGSFKIDRLIWGEYTLETEKEEAGYMRTGSLFFASGPMRNSVATVGPKEPEAEVRIMIGPKAGIVSGTITDAVTRKPIPSASLVFHDWNGSDEGMSGRWVSQGVDSTFRVLLPPRQLLGLSVRAPGYKVWRKPTPTDLEPGAELAIKIALDPLPNGSR